MLCAGSPCGSCGWSGSGGRVKTCENQSFGSHNPKVAGSNPAVGINLRRRAREGTSCSRHLSAAVNGLLAIASAQRSPPLDHTFRVPLDLTAADDPEEDSRQKADRGHKHFRPMEWNIQDLRPSLRREHPDEYMYHDIPGNGHKENHPDTEEATAPSLRPLRFFCSHIYLDPARPSGICQPCRRGSPGVLRERPSTVLSYRCSGGRGQESGFRTYASPRFPRTE
jgi:hypothetical protein